MHVPGSFELPLAAELCLSSPGGKVVDAVIALGCVVKGSTPHFQFVCDSMSQGLMNVSVKHQKPVGFGVLTVDNIEQALARKDKGAEAAQAALAMSLFREQLEHHPLDHRTQSSSLTLDRSDLENR
jgi:6,7-dimethyl-8-ribityllumazine synthase